MKLFELEELPLPFTVLQKLLKANQHVVLVVEREDGTLARMGKLVKAEAKPSAVFGIIYLLTYFTNADFEFACARWAMERAKVRMLTLKGGLDEEKCFIVPSVKNKSQDVGRKA